jgi:hypothetical protein
MIKEIKLDYTINTLVQLSKDKYGDNATEYLAGRLQSIITDNQLQVLIDSLRKATNE